MKMYLKRYLILRPLLQLLNVLLLLMTHNDIDDRLYGKPIDSGNTTEIVTFQVLKTFKLTWLKRSIEFPKFIKRNELGSCSASVS